MKKIISIVGARPQFIKIALLSRELRKHFREIIVHTGQHYDLNMSEIFFKDLKLPEADYNLGVGSTTHGRQTAKMLEGIEKVLLKEKPELVLIYGDTNSTVAGALAAVKLPASPGTSQGGHIPVAHIEAGMRSYNRQMPEEINRVVSDHISDLLFCSTRSAVEILKKEGIKKGVYFVGDVMADLQKKIKMQKSKCKIMEKLSLKPKEYILATVHRQENTDKKANLQNITEAFNSIQEAIVWPMHPRTKKYLREFNIKLSDNIKVIEPLGYQDMICLETNAKMILTDSGGVQKEAYLAKVPCLTLRNETEWVETVKSGWNHLAGTNVQKIIRLVQNFPCPKSHPDFLGNGEAYKKIARIIKKFLS